MVSFLLHLANKLAPPSSPVEEVFYRRKAEDFLLHLNIARGFLEEVTGIRMPEDIFEFQDRLRNGVYLARLALILSQKQQFLKVFDEDQAVYDKQGLQHIHINNIQTFLMYLRYAGLPAIFHPEIADIYEKKNMAKLFSCLRALMHHLGIKDIKPVSNDFSDNTINKVKCDLLKRIGENFEFNFEKFEDILLKSDFDGFCGLIKALVVNPLGLEGVVDVKELCLLLFEEMKEARAVKGKLLTIHEVVDISQKQMEVYKVSLATFLQSKEFLLQALSYDPDLKRIVKPKNVDCYMSHLALAIRVKKENNVFNYLLTHADIVDAIQQANNTNQDL